MKKVYVDDQLIGEARTWSEVHAGPVASSSKAPPIGVTCAKDGGAGRSDPNAGDAVSLIGSACA